MRHWIGWDPVERRYQCGNCLRIWKAATLPERRMASACEPSIVQRFKLARWAPFLLPRADAHLGAVES